MTTVTILGCGYVGLELARRLQDDPAIEAVVGVRRSDSGISSLNAAGITAIQGDLTSERTLSSLPESDVVVFAASSGGADAREIYVDGQRAVLEYVSTQENLPERYLYMSSTGVYGNHDGQWVDEGTPIEPETEREQILVDAETVALDVAREYGISPTVARFGGLYGPERFRLDRYLDGPVTEGVLNLTHRDDAAGTLAFFILEVCARDEIVLVVDDEPVSKWELADWLASECGRPEPPKQTREERLSDESLSVGARRRIRTEKRCRNDKLRSLGYEHEYPTFRAGFQQAIDAFTTSTSG